MKSHRVRLTEVEFEIGIRIRVCICIYIYIYIVCMGVLAWMLKSLGACVTGLTRHACLKTLEASFGVIGSKARSQRCLRPMAAAAPGVRIPISYLWVIKNTLSELCSCMLPVMDD